MLKAFSRFLLFQLTFIRSNFLLFLYKSLIHLQFQLTASFSPFLSSFFQPIPIFLMLAFPPFLSSPPLAFLLIPSVQPLFALLPLLLSATSSPPPLSSPLLFQHQLPSSLLLLWPLKFQSSIAFSFQSSDLFLGSFRKPFQPDWHLLGQERLRCCQSLFSSLLVPKAHLELLLPLLFPPPLLAVFALFSWFILQACPLLHPSQATPSYQHQDPGTHNSLATFYGPQPFAFQPKLKPPLSSFT